MRKQNDEITVRSLLEIFIPKLWIAVIVAVILGIVFGVYSSTKKDTYTSSGLYMFSKTNYNNQDLQTGLTAAEVEAMQAMIANGKVIIDTTKFARSVFAGLMQNNISEVSAKMANGEVREVVAQNIYYGDKVHVAYAIDATVEEANSGAVSVTYKWTSGDSVTLESASLLDTNKVENLYKTTKKIPVYTPVVDSDGNPVLDDEGNQKTEITDYDEIDVEYPIFISVGRTMSESVARNLRSMMSVSLSSDDTTCYKLNVTTTDPDLARDVAVVAGEELVKIYQFETKYAIEIIQLDDPTVPVAPNSKNVSRNAIIGFVGGLLLSLLVIFVLSRFDVVIRSREKIEESFDVPILGVIPRVEITDLQHRGNAKSE